MTKYPNKEFFELEVENFGPIEEGKVQLRPLTVFIGPSNTGKSYLAVLVYALHQFFGDDTKGFLSLNHEIFHDLEDTNLIDSIIDQYDRIFETVEERETVSEPIAVTLPKELSTLIGKGYARLGEELVKEIQRCFGFDSGDALIWKFGGKGAKVFLRHPKLEVPNLIQHNLTIAANSSKFETLVPENLQLQTDVNRLENLAKFLIYCFFKFDQTDKGEKLINSRYLSEILHLASQKLAGHFNSSAFYLPADRAGVMHVHSIVTSTLIERTAMTGLQLVDKPALKLSGVMADFLEQLNRPDYQEVQQNERIPKTLSEGIEDSILGGKVSMRKSSGTNYPRFTYKPNGWSGDLSLMNASSMVSELTPIVLFLRNVVSPGCTLIIEEPESHLHPAMQVQLTRQIAKMVDAGINVVVTTHSEWVLEELANIVKRSDIDDNLKSKLDGEDIALRPDQVGAWQFKPNEKRNGSTIAEIQLDESGLYPSGFDEVAIELHNDWVAISNGIDKRT